MSKKKEEVYKDEDGRVLLGAVKKMVMEEEVEPRLKEVDAKMAEIDETLAYIKAKVEEQGSKLAEVGATARAAAIASAVPVDTSEEWRPRPIESYPEEWVEEHGIVDVAIGKHYDQPSITINSVRIPVRPGIVFQVPGNVARRMEEIGLLGTTK